MKHVIAIRKALFIGLYAFGLCGAASATVTTLASYKLGEADAGATVGALAANPTLASVGAVNLPRVGAPTYSNTVPTLTRPSPLSVAFNGASDGFRVGSVLSTVTDNFGIEAWVRPTSNTGDSQIAYNGNTATSGWGLFRQGSDYAVLYGGNAVLRATGSVDLNQWTHLAVVRASGTTTLYKNGVSVATMVDGPNAPAGGFSIGINPLLDGEYFAGNIDEVRVFTFAAGQFTTSDLSSGLAFSDPVPAVPTVSTLGLTLTLLLLFIAGARFIRRR
ncbi:MAG: LamG domain-containing protein [Betaproteobacteria bacterium]|nr:MAG: LamG domain-containing protein [Betaproteobacteria bacterium]